MAKNCTQRNQIRDVTPNANGCEDCLKIRDHRVYLLARFSGRTGILGTEYGCMKDERRLFLHRRPECKDVEPWRRGNRASACDFFQFDRRMK